MLLDCFNNCVSRRKVRTQFLLIVDFYARYDNQRKSFRTYIYIYKYKYFKHTMFKSSSIKCLRINEQLIN